MINTHSDAYLRGYFAYIMAHPHAIKNDRCLYTAIRRMLCCERQAVPITTLADSPVMGLIVNVRGKNLVHLAALLP